MTINYPSNKYHIYYTPKIHNLYFFSYFYFSSIIISFFFPFWADFLLFISAILSLPWHYSQLPTPFSLPIFVTLSSPLKNTHTNSILFLFLS